MIRNAEALLPGDRRMVGSTSWVVVAAEMQEGRMQVIWWDEDEERSWDEYEPGTPVLVTPAKETLWVRGIKNASALVPGDRRLGTEQPPFTVAGVDATGPMVVVEWTNGAAIRVREYEPHVGILVESRLAEL